MGDAGLDLMYGLVLENGDRWGQLAVDQQRADAEAIFGPEKPHRHFLTRPRGGSKTSDLAGVALSWLAVEAPVRARGYVVAANGEQAGILIDAAASFVARTPELDGVLTVENEKIVAANGAWVRVLNLSDSGAWGLRDAHLLILDEFAQWPETRGAKRVYTAVRSTVQKVDGCRLVILTSAGEPSHWTYEGVFKPALTDPLWRVSEMPGPVPWQDPEEIEALRRELRPSEFDRLVLNIWSEDEDRAIAPEDYELAAQKPVRISAAPTGLTGGGYRLRHPRPGIRYLITVDIGTRNDATVMAVSHKEPIDPEDRRGPHRVVVDHLERWAGSRKRPVQLKDVEDWLARAAPEFNGARVYADPDQFVGSIQNLNRRGVRAQEWAFTSSSVGQVATALVQVFRNRQIWVPDSEPLKKELLRVRLRESVPGVTRLDHEQGGHDDQAVVLGMAAHLHLGSALRSGLVWAEGHRKRMEKLAGAQEEADDEERATLRRQRRCRHLWSRSGICCACGVSREALERANPHPARSAPSRRAFDPRRTGRPGGTGLPQSLLGL